MWEQSKRKELFDYCFANGNLLVWRRKLTRTSGMYCLATPRKSAHFDQTISFHRGDEHLDSHKLHVLPFFGTCLHGQMQVDPTSPIQLASQRRPVGENRFEALSLQKRRTFHPSIWTMKRIKKTGSASCDLSHQWICCLEPIWVISWKDLLLPDKDRLGNAAFLASMSLLDLQTRWDVSVELKVRGGFPLAMQRKFLWWGNELVFIKGERNHF